MSPTGGRDRPGLLLWHLGRRGGGPRFTFELARALAARPEVRVHLALSRQSELFAQTAALGLPVLAVDTYSGGRGALAALPRVPFVARQFRRYVQQHRLGTAFCTMTHLWNPAILPALRRGGAANALIVHDAAPHAGDRLPALRRFLTKLDLRHTDRPVVLSAAVRTQLLDGYRVAPERLTMFPHAGFLYGDPPPPEGRPAPQGRPARLLFFGRLLPYKGLHLLLEAFRLLRDRGQAVELVLAGQGSLDGLAVPEGVTVIDRWIAEAELPPLFAAADLVVLPYIEASQSGVLAIALPLGIPAVVTPVGALPEQIGEGRAGVVAAVLTAGAVADAIQSALSDYATLTRGAVAVSAETMDWTPVADCVLKLIAPQG